MNLVIRKCRHVGSPERLLDHRAALCIKLPHCPCFCTANFWRASRRRLPSSQVHGLTA
jgi:hypothetical protein